MIPDIRFCILFQNIHIKRPNTINARVVKSRMYIYILNNKIIENKTLF